MFSQLMKCFLALITIFVLAHCAQEDEENKESPNPENVGPAWNINSVSLTCGDPSMCPDNQGILLVVNARLKITAGLREENFQFIVVRERSMTPIE